MLRSPARILAIVLSLVFIAEVCVMLILPYVIPVFWGDAAKAYIDAILLTLICAPALWWIIISPLRRIAIQEHLRSETIVANASEGILTVDQHGIVRSCNRASTGLLNCDVNSMIGRNASSFFTGFPADLQQVPIKFFAVTQCDHGKSVSVEISISEYPSESQPLYVVILRDLTAAEKSEAERLSRARETEALRAQQMATLAQLATGVAHEIRNPLTSIKMLIQVNRDAFASAGLPTDDLELVENEIRRMERSVNGLLDFARPEEGLHCDFEIREVIRKTTQLIEGRCQQQSVELWIQCPTESMKVRGDAAQIQQLLLNLSLNALDVMPSGGRLVIHCDPSDDSIKISVVDSGSGIREEILQRLFTPFATTKPTGVGLGLSICKRIAESHGGTLTGENRSVGGAEFCLTLPRLGIVLESDSRSANAPCKAY